MTKNGEVKSIALVLNDAGTFFTHRAPLVRFLKQQGWRVDIICPASQKCAEIRLYADVIEWSVSRKGLNPFAQIKCIYDLFVIYSKKNYSIVHHFTIKPVLYGSIAAKLAGIKKIVNTITGLGFVFTENKPLALLIRPIVTNLYKIALKPSQKTAICTVFQNHDDQSLFEALKLVKKNTTQIIPGSGVDTEKFTPTPEPPITERPIVILPARMLWQKGVGEAIKASAILREKGHPIDLWLVGGTDPGNPESIPEETLQAWESEGLCRWLGEVKDMRKIYQQSHLVILPSYREGLPMALLEAGASGRGIIATDVPGCRELIQNGENGLLCKVKSARDLSEKILEVLKYGELKGILVKKNIEKISSYFCSTKINQQYVKIYS